MAKTKKKAFKDWFDPEAAERLADQVAAVWPAFDHGHFITLATRDLETLEFQARVFRFSEALADTLSEDRKKALRVLTESLPPPLPDCESVTDGWLQWPVGQFIADHGTGEVDAAFEAMIELTQRFSAEFAVRPFAERDPEDTVRRLSALKGHESPHVRRWCSEGLRPRLPWGRKLHAFIENPGAVLPILEALRADPEPYVRKSVANHLNDIAKDHPDLVIGLCRGWYGACPETDGVVRHGLRTLIKDGHPDALRLLGFTEPDEIQADLRIEPDRVSIGGKSTLHLTLTNTGGKDRPLLVDYIVHYLRKNGTWNPKVFKWKTLDLPAGDSRALRKTHAFKPTTIRALYPGEHRIEIQVNGKVMSSIRFHLAPASDKN